MSIRIDREACAGCLACTEVCPGNLIRADGDGLAFIRHPEECWGCASCLKECAFGAISYFLGADIGGRGSTMRAQLRDGLWYWTVERDGKETAVIAVNPKNANQY